MRSKACRSTTGRIFDERFERLTPTEIRQYAEEYLKAENGVSLILGPNAVV
jgi:hypothetical protein